MKTLPTDSTWPVHSLPKLNDLPRDLEPIALLLETLAYLAKNPCTTCTDPDQRRQLLYTDAITHLAATFPEDRRKGVYERHAEKLMTCGATPKTATADELRIATLAAYGWACDRAANSDRNRGNGIWIDAATVALERYRTHNRVTKHLSDGSAHAVPA